MWGMEIFFMESEGVQPAVLNFKGSILASGPLTIPACWSISHQVLATLELITEVDLEDVALTGKISQWRNKHRACFLTEFESSAPRTKAWLATSVVRNPARALFKILDAESEVIGHVGAIHRESFIEYDYYILEQKIPVKGLALMIAKEFLLWICAITGLKDIVGHVRSDNLHALDFHRRTGFAVKGMMPLKRVVLSNGDVHYRAAKNVSQPDLFIVQITATPETLCAAQTRTGDLKYNT
jgi:hypothetical protein